MLLPSILKADIYERSYPMENGRWVLDPQLIGDCVSSVRYGPEVKTNAYKDCVGLGAAECLENSDISGEGLYDRPSYGACIELERTYWEWRLGRTIAALSGEFSDEEWREHLVKNVPELEAMVAVWRAFADVRCSYASRSYGIGASRGREGDIVVWSCKNRQTAAFALDLEAQLRGYCASQTAVIYGTACVFDQ